MSWLQVALVLVMGIVVGLDQASVPQVMVSRPLVAGTLGGLAVGHPLPGLAVGALLELFALETLPVGGARYSDWGPGSLAVGALMGMHWNGIDASALLGLVLVAVATAWVSGWLILAVRRMNVVDVAARRAALDAGDLGAVVAVQRAGLLRDATRGLGLTAVALGAGDLVHRLLESSWRGPEWPAQLALVTTSVGVALYAGWRLAGLGRHALWFVGGVGAGTVGALLWLH